MTQQEEPTPKSEATFPEQASPASEEAPTPEENTNWHRLFGGTLA